MLLPAINVDRGVYRLPDEMTYEEATFIEPLACVFRAQRMARLTPGQTVLVIGSGISGLLHIQLARSLGAGPIIATDVSAHRLKAAKDLGAERFFKPGIFPRRRLRRVNEGYLADRVIVCTGAEKPRFRPWPRWNGEERSSSSPPPIRG